MWGGGSCPTITNLSTSHPVKRGGNERGWWKRCSCPCAAWWQQWLAGAGQSPSPSLLFDNVSLHLVLLLHQLVQHLLHLPLISAQGGGVGVGKVDQGQWQISTLWRDGRWEKNPLEKVCEIVKVKQQSWWGRRKLTKLRNTSAFSFT